MKQLSPRLHCIVPLFAAVVLAACAGHHGSGYDRQQRDGGSSGGTYDSPRGGSSGGMTGQSGMMGQMDASDLKSMCDTHQRMLDAKTPDDRRAMMDERMRNMSPDEFQRHLDMMQAQCR